jgi:hypothetical protein
MHFVGSSGQKSTRKSASPQLTPNLKRAWLTVGSAGWLSDSAPSRLLQRVGFPTGGNSGDLAQLFMR